MPACTFLWAFTQQANSEQQVQTLINYGVHNTTVLVSLTVHKAALWDKTKQEDEQ